MGLRDRILGAACREHNRQRQPPMSGGIQWLVIASLAIASFLAYHSGLSIWAALGGFVISFFGFAVAVRFYSWLSGERADLVRLQKLREEYGEIFGQAIY